LEAARLVERQPLRVLRLDADPLLARAVCELLLGDRLEKESADSFPTPDRIK
jgi:hypothetical protein